MVTGKVWPDLLEHKWAVGLWLALNIADSVLTHINLSLGAKEVWTVYHLTGSMTATTIAKWAGVVLVVVVLGRYRRLRWLRWFCIGILLVVLWLIIELLVIRPYYG